MTREEVFSLVQAKICEVLPDISPEQVTAQGRMKDLGANSIDRMEVVTELLAHLGIQVPLVAFGTVDTIGGLVEVLHKYANGKPA